MNNKVIIAQNDSEAFFLNKIHRSVRDYVNDTDRKISNLESNIKDLEIENEGLKNKLKN